MIRSKNPALTDCEGNVRPMLFGFTEPSIRHQG